MYPNVIVALMPSLTAIAFFVPVLSLLCLLFIKVNGVKRKFRNENCDIGFRQALNVMLQGGYKPEVAQAAAKAHALRLEIPLDKLQLHAAAGGDPVAVTEALSYIQDSDIPSLRAGFKHLSLIDQSGKNVKQTITEAEKTRTLELEGELEFSGRTFRYDFKARYRRPLLSVAFDNFSEAEIVREIKRNIEDIRRYHKELIRVDVADTDQIERHLIDTVLRPSFWERNLRLQLVDQDLKLTVPELPR